MLRRFNIMLDRLTRARLEVAAAALFLAADGSSYGTGMDLAADGGISQV